MRLATKAIAAATIGFLIPVVCAFTPAAQGPANPAAATPRPIPDTRHLTPQTPNPKPQTQNPILVTAAPAYQPLAALKGGERFPKGAQLMRIDHGVAAPLVPGFAATADANVFWDATTVLFSARPSPTDHWQIWELNLATHSTRKLIASNVDLIRPMYLPAGQLVYASRQPQGFRIEVAGKANALKLAPIDDDASQTVQPLSFIPASAIPVDVLRDGRILFESDYPLGTGSTPELFLVYSDGSGVESYRCDHGRARWGGRQLANGDIVFTHGASLARFTSPLAHEAAVPAPHADFAGGIQETPEGAWLASTRSTSSSHYALKLWKPGAPAMTSVLADSGKDLVDPVLIAPRPRPNQHPTGLHPWNYANLLSIDSRQSRMGDLTTAPAQVRLETLNPDGRTVVTGTAPVESDGSFFVQTPADQPIRFALLDAKGAVVRREQGWFWIRKGEQRYCVGCHTGPERASENRVPSVLMRTTTPADLTGAKPAASADAAKSRGN
jgi:hypothetical protein